MAPTRAQRPIEYRDRQRRVWYVSEVAKLKVVSPATDGPNVALVILFEREGEERLARWIGGDDWQQRTAPEQFEQQVFRQWDRRSLVAVRRAIDARRRELAS